MPITPTYPGVYIEELPSNSHTITPAPTSIGVFIGYSHPFKTKSFGVAVRLFSFADYEREFGGFFTSQAFEDEKTDFSDLAHSVYQFFLNGGSDCYVVGLQPKLHKGNTAKAIDNPTGNLDLKAAGKKMLVTGLEPTDKTDFSITLTLSNFQTTTSNNDTADIVVTYGSRVETYRQVTLTGSASTDALVKGNYIENRINGISSIIKVGTPGDAEFDTSKTSLTLSKSPDTSGGFTDIFDAADFTAVFKADTDLDKVPIFNLMVMPGVTSAAVVSSALAFCEKKMAFYIMDPSTTAIPTDVATFMSTAPKSANGALYFPYVKSANPNSGSEFSAPPSGTVAGIFARTDVKRGVWKAPAGLETTLLNVAGVVDTGRMNDPRQGVLNDLGINCLRSFPNIGTVVYGARTLVSANKAYEAWKYVPVRRMALFIEQTLLRNLTWAVFEPNDVPLWDALRISVENFMLGLFNQGALQGTKPSEAFRVICDATTTTPSDVANGIVNIVVMFAPLKPAEFVIVKIGQLAGQAQA